MMTDHGHSSEEISERLSKPFSRNYLRDFIYGGIDGAVTTFAIVAGVEGAGFSRSVIIVLGIANILADGFSMAASNYSGTKAERDNVNRLREVERQHIEKIPEGEREEVRQILQAKGLRGAALEQAVEAVTADKKTWIDLMLVDEYGVSPVSSEPISAASATFLAFMLCGIVPLLPFLIGVPDPFVVAVVVTFATFFAIGTAKSIWTLAPWWRSGLETLFIGAAAAIIAYLAGSWIGAVTA
jgi:VIT1/CCC1 family predicted Fe2+/Mn2+ transporter